MKSKYFFPRATLRKMAKLGLSESTTIDVFLTGESIRGKQGMVKKYSGCEVGLFYEISKITGEYVFKAVWKKDRR